MKNPNNIHHAYIKKENLISIFDVTSPSWCCNNNSVLNTIHIFAYPFVIKRPIMSYFLFN